jgi:hypothetical protein
MGAKLYKNVAMNYYFIFKTQKIVEITLSHKQSSEKLYKKVIINYY